MTTLEDFEPASFAGIVFPFRRISIRCSLEKHNHKYPHTPGAKPEKMGRNPYEFDFEVPAYSGLLDPRYASLWPDKITVLRETFENEETHELHIPSIGKVKAFCVDWGQEFDGKATSGSIANWKFQEDNTEQFLIEEMLKVGPTSIQQLSVKLQEQAAEIGQPNLFDSIMGAVDSVLAVRDQALVRASLLESKVNYLTYLCAEADRTFDIFNDPGNWRILEALKELWSASRQLAANFIDTARRLQTYTTPTLMSISEVSAAIYGDTTRAMDILQLNAIEDAFFIPAGTRIRHFAE